MTLSFYVFIVGKRELSDFRVVRHGNLRCFDGLYEFEFRNLTDKDILQFSSCL